MKVSTPEISWHEREPVYSCAYHPTKTNVFGTAGVTGVIRLWEINSSCAEKISVDFLASLKRHTKAVNVIKWNHDGEIIASAGDEGVIFLWNENDVKNQKTLDNDEDESKENWFAFKTLRGHLEDVLDICWSKDSTILISGSIDNSAIVWNVTNGNKVAILKEPKGFVQGVCYDPIGSYYGIISTDRSLRFYNSTSNKCIFNVNRITINKENCEPINSRMFHDDTMKSFFRRLTFSFDGNFIFSPAGCLEIEDKIINVSYIFTRNNLQKPCFYVPHDKASIAISVCPLKFQLRKSSEGADVNSESLFVLPYRLVFAIATEDSVQIYDTQHLVPFAYLTGIHYSNITDLSWTKDGSQLAICSIDGFVTFATFEENELGVLYEEEKVDECETAEMKTEKAEGSIKSLFSNMAKSTSNLSNGTAQIQSTNDVIMSESDTSTAKPASTTNTPTNKDKNSKRIKLVPL